MSFLTNMFGNTKVTPPPPVTPTGFKGGGMNGEFQGNDYVVGADANRQGAVGNLANTFGSFGDETGALRATVAPGLNDMLKSRLTDLNNNASSAIGNLAENLRSRRVLGSSFGQDTLTRLQNTIQQNRDSVIADNYQKSLAMNNTLLTQQYNAYAKQYQTGLDELNLEADKAASLSAKAADILQKNAALTANANQFNANMSNNQATGVGSFLWRMLPTGGLGSMLGAGAAGADSGAAAAAGMGTAADSAALLAELGPLAAI